MAKCVNLESNFGEGTECSIDWGDSSPVLYYNGRDTYGDKSPYHVYPDDGDYKITIRGKVNWVHGSNANGPVIKSITIPEGEDSAITGLDPGYLTHKNTEVDYPVGPFEGQEELTSIPSNLFSNLETPATSTWRWFKDCTALESIPAELFTCVDTKENEDGTRTVDFDETFTNCTTIASVPENLFKSVLDKHPGDECTCTINRCFQACTGLEHLPELWTDAQLGEKATEHTLCFSQDNTAENYNDCPIDWGGPNLP